MSFSRLNWLSKIKSHQFHHPAMLLLPGHYRKRWVNWCCLLHYVLSSNIINSILAPQGTIIKLSFLLAFSNISFILHPFFQLWQQTENYHCSTRSLMRISKDIRTSCTAPPCSFLPLLLTLTVVPIQSRPQHNCFVAAHSRESDPGKEYTDLNSIHRDT